MKKFIVSVDYFTTVNVIVEARDEESAENKVRRYVDTEKGSKNALAHMLLNVPDGFDIGDNVEEWEERFRDLYPDKGLIDLTSEDK